MENKNSYEEIPSIRCSKCSIEEAKRPGILCDNCYKSKITKLHGQSEFLSSNCVFDKHKDFVREDVYHQENLPSKNTTEVQKDCPVCQYFRTNSAQISGKDETGVVRVFGELLKKDLIEQSESMLKKVVEITSSASVLALTANALQKELDEKRAVLAESEKEILCLIRERYSNLIDEAIKTHNQSMKPLIKEKEEIAFSVSRAMAVYKDVQHAFSQDVLSFFSEIKNVQTRLYQSNEDVDALLKRLKEYQIPRSNGSIFSVEDSLLRKGISELDVFLNTTESAPIEGEIRQFDPKNFENSREIELMRFKILGDEDSNDITFQYNFETLNNVTICFYPAKSTCTDTNVRITCLDSKVLHFHLSSEHFSIIQPFQMPFAVGVGSLKRKGDVLVCTSQERL